MNDVHSTPSQQTTDHQSGGKASASRGNAMHGDACIFRAASQQGIAEGDQFGGVAAREQAPHEQQRLMLSSTIIPTEVDNQRVHAQASPGFGHERCVSFSPARSRPSLRYLM